MIEKDKNTIPFAIELVIIFYVCHTSMPIVGFYTPAIVNVGVLLILYGFLLSRTKTFFHDVGQVLPIFSITILGFIYGGIRHFGIELYGLLQLFIFPLLGLYFYKYGESRTLKRMFFYVLVSYLVTAITTYFGCKAFPGASRQIAAMLDSKEAERYALYMSYNIGSFSFVYSLVLLSPIVIYLLRDKKIPVVFGLVMLIVIALTIIEAEYTIALISFVVILLIFFLPKYIKRRHLITIVIAFVLLYAFGQLFLGQWLVNLSQKTTSEEFAVRLYDLGVFFSSGIVQVENGDMTARLDLYKVSIDAFKAHPLFGSGVKAAGGHSFFWDNLGKFGLLGLFAMIIMYSRIFKLFYKSCRNNCWFGYVSVAFFVAIIFVIVNPKDNLGMLMFTIPLFMSAFNEDNDIIKKNENTLDCK